MLCARQESRVAAMHTLRTLTLAALIAGSTAAPAAADSIAYIKDGNVQLATPDGAKTVAVTTTGGYSSVSQSDDGRMIALHGKRFHLLSRWGDVLADFSPVSDGTAGTITLSGPFDPAISPDGSRVAYGFYVQYKSGDPNCGKPGGCQVGQLYTGTGYSKSDGPVEWSTPGYQPQYSWTDPSWIDNTRTLLSSPTSGLVTEAAVDTAGDGQDALQWFSDNRVGNLGDGDMNRQETAVAFVGNTQADRLLVYRTGGTPQAGTDPTGCLDAPATGGPWSSPTWSPDGQRLAWAGPQGIYTADLTGIGAACPDASKVAVTAFAPGATSPDWGPSELPGPRPAVPVTPTTPTSPSPTGQPSPQADPTRPTDVASESVIEVVAVSLKRFRSRGLTARVACSGAGKVTVTAKQGKRTVGSGKATCRSGKATVTVRLTPSGRKALRSVKTVRITLRSPGAADAKLKLR